MYVTINFPIIINKLTLNIIINETLQIIIRNAIYILFALFFVISRDITKSHAISAKSTMIAVFR